MTNAPPIPSGPIKFLGATVLSFNCSLGLGSTSESTLSVELVEDCNNGDLFKPNTGDIIVGAPVMFPTYSPQEFQFGFGGILQNWTCNIGKGGKTFSCTITDPRQLLENAVVVFQNYMDVPQVAKNYFNVYAYLEGQILYTNSCSPFGNMKATERGVPYNHIISQLNQGLTQSNMNYIYSPTGYRYKVNFASFPGLSNFGPFVPNYLRIPGPSMSFLDMLQLVCDSTGCSFYTTLDLVDDEFVINVGYVDLRQEPILGVANSIKNQFGSNTTEISYGQELRNDKTKAVIMGEQQHYMGWSNQFAMYFGEDYDPTTGIPYPIVPVGFTTATGFWLLKSLRDINPNLYQPFPTNGPFFISELDIRAAMASFDIWQSRALSLTACPPGSLNLALRTWYYYVTGGYTPGLDLSFAVASTGLNDVDENRLAWGYIDMHNAPGPTESTYNNVVQKDLEAIHGWVKNLGETYYGKQWACLLNQKICVIEDPDSKELPWPKNPKYNYSDIPTSAGGWVEYSDTILGLSEPDLGLFKTEDGRLGAFLGFYNATYNQYFLNNRYNPDFYPKPENPPENNNMNSGEN